MQDPVSLSPAGKLYSPGRIALAALLGGPAAGGWFIARDERQLGRPGNARRWFWGSVIGTLVLVVIRFLLPPTFPGTGIAIGYVVGFYTAAKQLYGNIVPEHRAAGGAMGSWWTIIWVGLVFLVAFLVLIFVFVLLLPQSYTARYIPADQ